MDLKTIKDRIRLDSSITDYAKGILLIMINNQLRVSEALRINSVNVCSNGLISVYSSKVKRYISINVYTAEEYSIAVLNNQYELGSICNRYFIYRLFNRLGISFSPAGNKNKAVTHAIRHIAAQEIRTLNNGPGIISHALNHRSKKTQESYGKEKRV